MDTEQLVKEAQAAMGKGSVEERAEKVKLVLESSGCEHEGALVHASSLQQLVSARKAETEAACTLSFGEQRENAYARLSRACEACIHMALSSANALASVRPLRRTEGLALCDAIEELLCIDPRMEEQWEAHPQLLHSFLQSALSIAPSYIARALLSELTSRDFFPRPIPNRIAAERLRSLGLDSLQRQLMSHRDERTAAGKRKHYQTHSSLQPQLSAADVVHARQVASKQNKQHRGGHVRHDCEAYNPRKVQCDESVEASKASRKRKRKHHRLKAGRSHSTQRHGLREEPACNSRELAIVHGTPLQQPSSDQRGGSQQVEATPMSTHKTSKKVAGENNVMSDIDDDDALPPTPLIAICNAA